MLLVNWTPVAVSLPPPKPPLVRRDRPVKRVCGGPVERVCGGPVERTCGGPVARDCRPGRGGGDAAHDHQRRCSTKQQPDPSPLMRRKFQEARRRLRLKRRWVASDGRRTHVEVQCERVAPPEPDASSQAVQHDAAQTDLEPGYLRQLLRQPGGDRAATIKCKTGVDAATQVCHRDLVDFETEAGQVAGLLVADVLEQAAVRVMYEDDAAALRREQAAYVAKRRAERVEMRRLEHAEALRRRRGLRALADAERAAPGPTFRAVHGRALADHYAASLCAAAVRQLESADYLQGGNQLAAWVRDRLRGHCQRQAYADVRLDAIVGDVIVNRQQVHREIRVGLVRDDSDGNRLPRNRSSTEVRDSDRSSAPE